MRKYKRVILYTHDAVMFKMENGWNYMVDTGHSKIYVYALAGSYRNHQPYFKEGMLPEPLLKKAETLLQQLPLEDGVTYGQQVENEEQMPYNPWAHFEEE